MSANNGKGKKIAKYLKAASLVITAFAVSLPDSTPYSPRSICTAVGIALLAFATHIET